MSYRRACSWLCVAGLGQGESPPARRVSTLSLITIPFLVLFSALLVSAAMRVTGHAWAAWVGLLPLFLVVRMFAPGGALCCGALWGAAVCALTALGSGGVISPTLLSGVFLVSVAALYTGLGALLTRWIGFSPLVLAVGWMGVEFALQPLGLRNGLLAGMQGDGVLLHWLGGLFGYVLVAFLVAYANASLLVFLSNARLTIPRQMSFAGMPHVGASSSSQGFFCISLLVSRRVQPRAPPKPVLAMS